MFPVPSASVSSDSWQMARAHWESRLSQVCGLFFDLVAQGDSASWHMPWVCGSFLQSYGLQAALLAQQAQHWLAQFVPDDQALVCQQLRAGHAMVHSHLRTQDGALWCLTLQAHGQEPGVWHGSLVPARIPTQVAVPAGQLESAYRQQTALLQAVLESSSDVVVFAVDRNHQLLAFNQQFRSTQRLLWGKEVALGQSMLDIVDDEQERTDFCDKVQQVLSGQSLVIEDEYGDKQRQREYRQGFWSPIQDADGAVIGVTVFSLNISERRQAELELQQREQQLRTLMNNTRDVIIRYDRQLRCVYANSVVQQEMALGQVPVWGTTPVERYGPSDHAKELETQLRAVFASGHMRQFEWQRPMLNGRSAHFLIHISPEYDDDGLLQTVLVVGRDISELQASRERIHQMAFYDGLTGLPNRALLHERLQTMVQNPDLGESLAGVFMVDMDQFKAINDTMGHAAGDALLKQAAQRLLQCTGPQSTVARLGGDEFIVLVPQVGCVRELESVGQAILQQFRQHFVLDGKQVYVNCSLGIAQFPADSRDPGVLMQYADSAMYAAKRSGRNALSFYSSEMTTQAQERLALEMDLRRALHAGEMQLLYQAKVALQDHTVVGAEALLRWHHPVHGLIMPSHFIALAEDVGVIQELGMWVLTQACTLAVQSNQPGKRPVRRIAINLSPRQFRVPDLLPMVQQILQQTGCQADWLELEITEGLLLADDEAVMHTLRALRQLGFTIAIDDFGTGYSALGYLAIFPIDTLKIDRSFIQAMGHSAPHAELVKAILLMANALKIEVVAEGVETAQQAEFLLAHGCQVAQGYRYSYPLPADAYAQLPERLHCEPGC